MKKVGREPQKLETLSLFAVLQSGSESALNDPANRQAFLTQINSGLTNALSSESTLHGIRVQTMFRGLVANLGSVKMIKEEDAGECYYKSPDEILVPDFRVVTDKGNPLLIETKNHFTKDRSSVIAFATRMCKHWDVTQTFLVCLCASPSTGPP